MDRIKIFVMGMKSYALIVQFVQGIFVEKYDPTIEDEYIKTIELDGSQYTLQLLHTAGTEQFSAMRDLYIKNAQGFVIVFSINAQYSFNDVPEIREQIIRVKDTENIPLVLVGDNCHLPDQRVITTEQGQALATKFNCKYIEVSVKVKININEVFQMLLQEILKLNNKDKKKTKSLFSTIYQQVRKTTSQKVPKAQTPLPSTVPISTEKDYQLALHNKDTQTINTNPTVQSMSSNNNQLPFDVIAITSYTARNDKEITLEEGKTYTVLQTDGKDLWWQSKTETGSLGWFPANYTEIITKKSKVEQVSNPPKNMEPGSPPPKNQLSQSHTQENTPQVEAFTGSQFLIEDKVSMLNRLSTIDTSTPNLSPLFGINDYPSLPISEAISSIKLIVPNIDKYTNISLKKFSNESLEMTTDEAVAINLYTLEWSQRTSSLYFIMNNVLRNEDRATVKPFFPYLKLFLTGLQKLPKFTGTVWRGVNLDLRDKFPKGKEVWWWSFSSCTFDGDQMQTFLNDGPKTIFQINCKSGVNIQKFSNFPTEAEILLPPMILKVVSCFSVGAGSGVHIIELEDVGTYLVEL